MRTNLIIKLDGHHINTMIVIVANSIGPIVSVDKQELEYGNVEVLKDYSQKKRSPTSPKSMQSTQPSPKTRRASGKSSRGTASSSLNRKR